MKKMIEYSSEGEISKIEESEAISSKSNTSSKPYPVWSMKEALKTGMPLEESKRLLFERINRDFH